MNERDEDRKRALADKYDAIASTYSTDYADPDSVAEMQLRLIARWGDPLPAGASILELGCANGLVTERLVRAGYRVTAVDISPRMIETAHDRLSRAGLTAELRVGDVDSLEVDQTFDATLGLMRNFFTYVEERDEVLRKISAWTRRKIVVDLDPRLTDRKEAMEAVRSAGFSSVAWQPIFLPQHVRLPGPARGLMRGLEHVPAVRSAILKKKFRVALKGERSE